MKAKSLLVRHPVGTGPFVKVDFSTPTYFNCPVGTIQATLVPGKRSGEASVDTHRGGWTTEKGIDAV